MISFSVAWVLVTIIKQKDINSFEFNPAIFLFTGVFDVIMAVAIASVFAGVKQKGTQMKTKKLLVASFILNIVQIVILAIVLQGMQ